MYNGREFVDYFMIVVAIIVVALTIAAVAGVLFTRKSNFVDLIQRSALNGRRVWSTLPLWFILFVSVGLSLRSGLHVDQDVLRLL